MQTESVSSSDDPLALAAETGRRVLEAGGETYRAEATVIALCRVWSLDDAECFATPTGLMASVSDRSHSIDGSASSRAVVRRVSRRAVDLRRVARIAEEVSRLERSRASPAEFRAILTTLVAERPYRFTATLLAAGACAAFFTLLFGGVPRDAVAAFFVGVGVKATAAAAAQKRFPDFIVNIAGGVIAAALAATAVSIGLAVNLDKTVIGSIMLLVPGLAVVNAIRDTIAGDLVAGVARLADAFMAAAAISLGTGFVLSAVNLIRSMNL
jgi:uncharacterized membrane protein YjjP (DUF1212 family)